MFILGFSILLIAVCIAIYGLGGYVSDYLNVASFLFILVPLLAVLTATSSFKVFCEGFKAAIFSKRTVPEGIPEQSALLFRLMSKITVLASVLCMLICS